MTWAPGREPYVKREVATALQALKNGVAPATVEVSLSESDLNSFNGGLTNRLIKVVQQLLDQPAVKDRTFPIDQQLSDLGMSSLKMVNLMLSVESEFDIMIPQSDITPENFHSVASIAALVARIAPEAAGG